jgi:hypothetical protein
MHAPNQPIRKSSDAALSRFAISAARGFLPEQDPLVELTGSQFQRWERAAASLPKLLVSDQTRQVIDRLPRFDAALLKTPPELERALMILSYLGHAYVWGGGQPVDRIPEILAVPWHAVAGGQAARSAAGAVVSVVCAAQLAAAGSGPRDRAGEHRDASELLGRGG